MQIALDTNHNWFTFLGNYCVILGLIWLPAWCLEVFLEDLVFAWYTEMLNWMHLNLDVLNQVKSESSVCMLSSVFSVCAVSVQYVSACAN